MRSSSHGRPLARAALATELADLAAQYSTWALDFERVRAGAYDRELSGSVFARGPGLTRDFRGALKSARDLGVVMARRRDQDLIQYLESGHIPVGAPAFELADRLETTSLSLHRGGHPAAALSMACLARCLPSGRRLRFVAEVIGCLGMCESRQDRIRYLVGVLLGLPGLAWILHRDNRRGRA